MIMKWNRLWILPVFLLLLAACGEEGGEEGEGQDHPLVFTSLKAENDSVQLGKTTKITALAIGDQLSYLWKASLGDILGSGASVTYTPTPCSLGKVTVTCTVSDGHNKELSKEISLVVY